MKTTIIAVLCILLSGCATSVSYRKDNCAVKVQGLFFAHGLSVPVASECKAETE